MLRGLYTAASSMRTARKNLDIVSNNLANVNSSSYKRDEGINQSFPEMLMSKMEKGKNNKTLGGMGTGVRLDESYTDFSNGSFRYTGNDLDAAIRGDGFFIVETPEGSMYTRDGNFTINRENEIVTQSGYNVLNSDLEPIELENGEIGIDGNGQIYQNNTIIDELAVVDFNDQNLLNKVGENLYNIPADIEENEIIFSPENYQISQGYIEESNVNIVEEMTKMIEVNRLYEANQKSITTMDNTLQQAANQVGRLR